MVQNRAPTPVLPSSPANPTKIQLSVQHAKCQIYRKKLCTVHYAFPANTLSGLYITNFQVKNFQP